MGFIDNIFSNPNEAYQVTAKGFIVMADEWMKRFQEVFGIEEIGTGFHRELLISFLQNDNTINFLIGFADYINEQHGIHRNSDNYLGVLASPLRDAFKPYIDSDKLYDTVNFRIEEEFNTNSKEMLKVRNDAQLMAGLYLKNPQKYIKYCDAQGNEKQDRAMWWNKNDVFESWMRSAGY